MIVKRSLNLKQHIFPIMKWNTYFNEMMYKTTQSCTKIQEKRSKWHQNAAMVLCNWQTQKKRGSKTFIGKNILLGN